MFENLRADCLRYGSRNQNVLRYLMKGLTDAGFRAVMLYRMGHWFHKRRLRIFSAVIERMMHHLCHCWISTSAEIGSGFLIAHVGGVIVGYCTRIGNNCDIRQNVTLGGNFNKKDAHGNTQPILGDNVSLCAGAVVVGPVKIGSNSIIGANSVVTRDVPENSIVSGVPGVVIKKRWEESTGRGL